jgi:hypothetical protein
VRKSFALAGFVAACTVLLAATVPMRWLGELAVWRSAGLSATGATGTIWSGRLLGVASGAQALGDVEAGLSATALLAGTAAIGFQASAGRGTLLLGRQRGLRNASGQWPLTLRTAGASLPVLLKLQDATAVFRGAACHEASGRATATVALPAAVVQAPELVVSGALACREGVVEATLLPEPGSPAVELLVQARADGRYRLRWTARAPGPALEPALVLAGFTPSADGWVREDEGPRAAQANPQE